MHEDRPSSSPIPVTGFAERAVRDAATIAERAAADEAAARALRTRNGEAAPESIDADETVAPVLAPGEVVLAVRPSAGLERVPAPMDGPGRAVGHLYLTSARLLLLGTSSSTIVDLELIAELQLLGERLLVLLPGGEALALDIDKPRVLRVQIAAAIAARRAAARGLVAGGGAQSPSR